MNESLDEIERQLRSWQPIPASAGLRERVGRRLNRARVRWAYAAAAAVLAAVGEIGVRTWLDVPFPRRAEPQDMVATNGGSPVVPASGADLVRDNDRPLTLWDYRLAALSSDEELAALVPPRRGGATQDEPERTVAGRWPSSLEESF